MDVLTGGLTKPSYIRQQQATHCLYCNTYATTTDTRTTRMVFHQRKTHTRTPMEREIRQHGISKWEPELKPPRQEMDDQTSQKARDLVNQLQIRRRRPKSTLSTSCRSVSVSGQWTSSPVTSSVHVHVRALGYTRSSSDVSLFE